MRSIYGTKILFFSLVFINLFRIFFSLHLKCLEQNQMMRNTTIALYSLLFFLILSIYIVVDFASFLDSVCHGLISCIKYSFTLSQHTHTLTLSFYSCTIWIACRKSFELLFFIRVTLVLLYLPI